MALTSIGGVVTWPELGSDLGNSTPNFLTTTYVLNALGDSAAAVLSPPKAGNISTVFIRTGTVTTGGTFDVRIETVDPDTGFPSGTLWGTTTNGALTIGNGDDNVLLSVNLTLAAEVTPDDVIAIVIVAPSGANAQISGAAIGQVFIQYPYGLLFDSGAWASIGQIPPTFGLQYDDGSFAEIPNIPIASTISLTSFGNGTNPNHRALRFQYPVPCRVRDLWVSGDLDGDADLLLVADDWDGTNGDALGVISLDTNIRRQGAYGAHIRPLPTPVELAANTTYRVVLKPTSATAVILPHFTVGSAAQLAQSGGNAEAYLSTANNPNDASDWTNTTTARPLLGICIDQFDNASGGGGVLAHHGMAGGLAA